MVCPLAGLHISASIGEAQLHILERERLMWGSGKLSPPGRVGGSILPQSTQTPPGASWKMEEAPPKKQVPQGTSWVELSEGSGQMNPRWRPAPPTGLG